MRGSNNSLPDFGVMVATGFVPGVNYINKFGINEDIDTTSDPEDIWSSGGVYTGHPIGDPETVEVFSSSAEDGAGTQTGALTLRFYGLRSSLSTEYEYEDVTLAGTGSATSVNTWYRVNRALVLTAGSTYSNVGTITLRHSTTTSNIFAVIPPTYGQTVLACWSVPHDNLCYFTGIRLSMSVSGGGAGTAIVGAQYRDLSGAAWKTGKIYAMQGGEVVDEEFVFPFFVEDFTDVRIRVLNVTSSNTRVHGGFSAFYGRKKAVRDAMLNRASL